MHLEQRPKRQANQTDDLVIVRVEMKDHDVELCLRTDPSTGKVMWPLHMAGGHHIDAA